MPQQEPPPPLEQQPLISTGAPQKMSRREGFFDKGAVKSQQSWESWVHGDPY